VEVEPEPPATVERMEVPSDLVASIVRGPKGSEPARTVFLPGMCSNAYAYMLGFPEAAKQQGGVVAIEGDQPCVPGFRSFSWDAPKLHRRIEAALAAAGRELAEGDEITLVGYSQGAALAEQLIQRWPKRYARLVLIGAPTDPSPRNFAPARGVVTMSCSLDVPWRMKEAARGIARTGVKSTYVEMPGCTHGNLAKGDETLGEAFAFLR
jgi:pimeloyl-ACP methyl ester carboxylesterase